MTRRDKMVLLADKHDMDEHDRIILNDLLSAAWAFHYFCGQFGHRMVETLITHSGENMVKPDMDDAMAFFSAIEYVREFHQDHVDMGVKA